MLLDAQGQTIDPATIEAVRRTGDERYPVTQRVPSTGVTRAGVTMTPDRALQISACWACTRFLSQTTARLPWNLRRRVRAGSEVVDSRHPVQWLLRYRVSDEFSSFQFRETMIHWALRWGNAFAEIEWSIGGRPLALWPIHPSRVTVVRDVETAELVYEVTGNNGGGTIYLDQWDVFHLRGLGEGPVGLSVMAYAAQSLGWAQAAQIFGASFFRQSANPSGIVGMKRALSPEALAVLRRDFMTLYGGPSGANKVVFLDADMEYTPISVEPEKGQFIETNQYLLDEICRWFGVPPHKIYNLLRATFSNIEHQTIEVVEDSIKPWSQRLQDEADHKLLGANRGSLYSEIETRALLRADTATRMQWHQGLRNIGAINVNEIRSEEGLNDIGPKGDKYTLQSGMTTLDKIGEDPAPAPAPPDPSVSPPASPASPPLSPPASRRMKNNAIIARLKNVRPIFDNNGDHVHETGKPRIPAVIA